MRFLIPRRKDSLAKNFARIWILGLFTTILSASAKAIYTIYQEIGPVLSATVIGIIAASYITTWAITTACREGK